MTIDKSALLKPRLPEREVEIPDVGTVRVRGLSRQEAIHLSQLAEGDTKDVDGGEVWLLVTCMVDPALTGEEAAAWRDASPAHELDPVFEAIRDISGLKEGAARETYDQFRGDGPGDGVRTGRGAGDDQGPATARNQ